MRIKPTVGPYHDNKATWGHAWVIIAGALKDMGAPDIDWNAAAIIARLEHAGLRIVSKQSNTSSTKDATA